MTDEIFTAADLEYLNGPSEPDLSRLLALLSVPCQCGAREQARAYGLPDWAVAAIKHDDHCPAKRARSD